VVVILLAILLVFVLGWVVVGLTFKLLWWALIGLIIGGLARLVLPGKQEISILATAGAGLVAALLGGIVAYAIDLGGFLQFIIAVGLAALLIVVFGNTRAARV
jgi:uncharacterized membrane protein YeaQ/YmgE (transglycosylase-associated protein family)